MCTYIDSKEKEENLNYKDCTVLELFSSKKIKMVVVTFELSESSIQITKKTRATVV